jgi:hypothetical protein
VDEVVAVDDRIERLFGLAGERVDGEGDLHLGVG